MRPSMVAAGLALMPVAASAAEGTAAAPVIPGVGAGYFVQVFLGLAVVVVGIFALLWLLKRMNRFQGGVQGRLRVIAAVPLGTRERAVVLQVGEEQVLLGVAPGRVSRLHVLNRPLEPAVSEATGENFKARLAAALGGRGKS
ncbi:flagellar biosynthetic protein FliO [Acidihalobacter aeolianus]|uniref:Flagellar protein n=2 Tax=Acidihalobacter aeolianus TaxID=2792603 RepID=A0A1D8KBX0_9GAMM|nr:flagellar biosynthetic protein FliO [Acidihalobacter aeolianus]